jgi:hypothetical protein
MVAHRTLIYATLTLALCSSACVVSVDEVVPATGATFDAALIGTWLSDDGKEAVITRGDSGSYDIAYTMRDTTGPEHLDGKTGHFAARLGTLGAHRVLDVSPKPSRGQIPDAYDGAFIPGHVILVLDLQPDELRFRVLEPDVLLKALRAGTVRMAYVGNEDRIKQQVVLKGSTRQLRTELAAYLGRKGALGDTEIFRRVHTAVTPTPPTPR